jgi:hypothetical protein
MSRIPTAVTVAPRGKVFRTVRMNHVVGGRVLPVLLHGSWTLRAEADAAANRIDQRLQPSVVLVDAVKAVEEPA